MRRATWETIDGFGYVNTVRGFEKTQPWGAMIMRPSYRGMKWGLLLLVLLPPGYVYADAWLGILTESSESAQQRHLTLVKEDAPPRTRTMALATGVFVVEAMFPIDNPSGARIGVVSRKPWGAGEGPTSQISILDLRTGRLGPELASLKFAVHDQVALPSLHRLYVSGTATPTGSIDSMLQFDRKWRLQSTRGAAFPWSGRVTEDDRFVWLAWDEEPKHPAGLQQVDIVSSRVTRTIPFPERGWWPGDVFVAKDGTVFVSTYFDKLDGSPKRRSIMVARRGAAVFSDLRVPRLGALVALWESGGLLGALGEVDNRPVFQLYDANSGQLKQQLPLEAWANMPSRISPVRVGDNVLALLPMGGDTGGQPPLLLDLPGGSATPIDVNGERILSALVTDLAAEDIAAIELQESAPREYRVLGFPNTGASNTVVSALSESAWQSALKRVRELLQPEYVPVACSRAVVPEWDSVRNVPYLTYDMTSVNEVPSWRLIFEWAMTLGKMPAPVTSARITCRGAWWVPLLLDKQDISDQRVVFQQAFRVLLRLPTASATPRDNAASRVNILPALTEQEARLDDGTALTVQRGQLPGLDICGWLEHGSNAVLHLQFADPDAGQLRTR